MVAKTEIEVELEDRWKSSCLEHYPNKPMSESIWEFDLNGNQYWTPFPHVRAP
jgi:hypothetical protein